MFNNYIQFTNLPLSKKTDALQQKLQHIINATYTQIFPHEIKNQLDGMVSVKSLEKFLAKGIVNRENNEMLT